MTFEDVLVYTLIIVIVGTMTGLCIHESQMEKDCLSRSCPENLKVHFLKDQCICFIEPK